ncbi:MAG: type II toxin-antitoxin system RelE family toxin, partial [Candidatus Anammoxibacter sp.]
TIQRIIKVVENLSSNSYPVGSRKLQSSEHLYRIRVGDCRVVYSVVNNILLIEVIRVGHRKDIYKKLT